MLIFCLLIFQSTPSQRGRRVIKLLYNTPNGISIHALAKRATINDCFQLVDSGNFNPRPRKEGDFIFTCGIIAYGRFQSTPSQRGRLIVIPIPIIRCLFQSTPSQRGRLFYNRFSQVFILHFNPRPRKEGDRRERS